MFLSELSLLFSSVQYFLVQLVKLSIREICYSRGASSIIVIIAMLELHDLCDTVIIIVIITAMKLHDLFETSYST